MRWWAITAFTTGCAFADPVVGTLSPRREGALCEEVTLACTPPARIAPTAPVLGQLTPTVIDTTMELRSVTWRALDVELRGNARLRVSQESSLEGVRIWGTGTLEVEQSSLSDVLVELDALALDRADATRLGFRGRRAELISSTVQDGSFHADDLWATELTGSVMSLDVERVTLASVELRSLGTPRCDTMRVVTSRLDLASIRCASELRVSRAVLANGHFEGPILSEATLWDGNVLGSPAMLRSRDDVLVYNQLCDASLNLIDAREPACNACLAAGAACASGDDLASLAEDNAACPRFLRLTSCTD